MVTGLVSALMKEQESIYRFIVRMTKENPGLPYAFQDVFTAGQGDALCLMLGDDWLSPTEKAMHALDLVEHVLPCLATASVSPALSAYLHEFPLIGYYAALQARIGLLLQEELVPSDLLYAFGLRLVTGATDAEAVKLGMLLLASFTNDMTEQLLRALGLHSEFTFFALFAARRLPAPNRFAFYLARNTCGWGKLAALNALEPVTLEQKNWLLREGPVNEVERYLGSAICLEKVDMFAYYENCELDASTFPQVAYLLAHAGLRSDIKDFAPSLALGSKFVAAAPKLASSFLDLAALVMIKNSMRPFWRHPGVDLEKQNGWTSNREQAVRAACNGLLAQPRWFIVAKAELAVPRYGSHMLITVLTALNLTPTFTEFLPLLEWDNFDLLIAGFMLDKNPLIYTSSALTYAKQVLPAELFTEGPLDVPFDEVTAEYKPDNWLVHLLQAMRKSKLYDEAFFLHCLDCRFPDVRIEAIHNLRACRTTWSEQVIPTLEHAHRLEPVKEISTRLLHLLGKSEAKPDKEQRYVDVSGLQVAPAATDICLLETRVAGTCYRDLEPVVDIVGSDDVLLLVREPDNQHDELAILVTAEDGYVLGYVPREDNAELARLLDEGERLYAVLSSTALEPGQPKVKVMLQMKAHANGNISPFTPNTIT